MKFKNRETPSRKSGGGQGRNNKSLQKKNGVKPKLAVGFKQKGKGEDFKSFKKNKGSGARNGHQNSRNTKMGGAFKGKKGSFKRGHRDDTVEIKEEEEDIKEEDEADHFFEVVGKQKYKPKGNDVDSDVKEESDDDIDNIKKGSAGGGVRGKNGKNKKKSGGFQGMGFSPLVLKGVLRRGYNVPTPIQRKVNTILR